MSGWAQDAAERQEEEAEHRRAAIRDPHNAAYHEARADLAEARAEIERLRALIRGVASGLTTYGRADEAAELLAMADGVPYLRVGSVALPGEGGTT